MRKISKIEYKEQTIYLMHDFKYNNTFYEFNGRYYNTLKGAKASITKYLKEVR